MSLIPEVSNPYIGAFAGGLLYGLAVCTASCLPYVASYVAGTGAGFYRGIKISLLFNSGRVLAYALIGALIGLFGGVFSMVVSSEAISPFQTYSSIAFGIVSIVIGASIYLKAKKPCNCNSQASGSVGTVKVGRFGVDVGAFSLGLTRGLILCPPLIALLVYSLPFMNPLGSVLLAVLFGLGTTLSPMLLLGGVTGWLLNKATLLRKWIAVGGAVILIALGIVTIVNSLFQLT